MTLGMWETAAVVFAVVLLVSLLPVFTMLGYMAAQWWDEWQMKRGYDR